MKKRINLLTKKRDYVKREFLFANIRKLTYATGILSLLFTILFYAINQRQQGIYRGLLFEKEEKLRLLLPQKEQEKKLAHINNKGEVLKKAMATDINFDAYFPLLESYLLSSYNKNSSNAASLEEIYIDNKKHLNLTFKLLTEEALYSLLFSTEQTPLHNLFEELKIEKITSIGNAYELELVGELKKI